jgi:hypothetical protein
MEAMKRHLNNFLIRFTSFWWGEKGLTALLVLLLASFLLASLFKAGIGMFISSIFLSLLLLSGIAAISKKKLHRAAVGVVVLAGIILTWLKFFYPYSRALHTWSDLVALFYLMLLTLVVMRHVFMEGPVTVDRVRGAIAAYILVGFTWAILYHLIELRQPGSFRLSGTAAAATYATQQSEFTYYSFVTMTTVGYGDITPVNPVARMFAVLEALIGQLYPATLLARLVSLQIMHRNEEGAREKARKERSGDGMDQNRPAGPE